LDVPQLLQPISWNKLKDDEKYGKKKGNHNGEWAQTMERP
jgi:hypothetical protein